MMSAEIVELQDSARRVLSGAGADATEGKLWPQVIALGWLLVSVPEELGGLGLPLSAACALYRELGAAVAPVPFLPAMLAMEAVCAGGLPSREAWVERLAAGTYVAASLMPPCVDVAPVGLLTLSGQLTAVPSADSATHLIVATETCVALVPRDDPAITVTLRPTWDMTRRLFDVRLSGVAVDDAYILATGAAAQQLVRRLATHRDFALAADCIGGAGALLDMTVEYLLTRRQFGRPLALFQALKHRCADLKTAIAAAEALMLDGLTRDDGDALHLAGLQAKSFASQVYARVAEEALQLHGGIGMTSEHGCHRFLKRSLLNAQLGQPADRYDLDIADAVLKGF